MILRFLVRRRITPDHARIVDFMAKVVFGGLAILWVSGIFYLISYAVFDPVKLGNQKVWAKIVIVTLLTINGHFIHHIVLPMVRQQVGRSLFDGLAFSQRSMLLMFGAISVTSWYIPLALGVAAFLNFVLPATVILAAYALIVALTVGATQLVARMIWRDDADPVAVRRSRRRPPAIVLVARYKISRWMDRVEDFLAGLLAEPRPVLVPIRADRRTRGPSRR